MSKLNYHLPTLTTPTDVQFLTSPNITSNSRFFYKDLTSNNYEHRIKLNPENETNIDLLSNAPVNQTQMKVIKEFPTTEPNAFEKADAEAEITAQIAKHKYQNLLLKEKDINNVVANRNKALRKEKKNEKEDMKFILEQIIKDSLMFSKKHNPIKSMLPTSIGEMIKKVKEDNIDISIGSVNISNQSIGKYNENEFLTSLGVDVHNLDPENVNVNIDKAYEYIDKWGNNSNRDLKQVLRYKVVNQIMSVEEKKASQKVNAINKKLNQYKRKKQDENKQLKKELEENMKSDSSTRRRQKGKMQTTKSQGKMMKTPVTNWNDLSKKKSTPVVEVRRPISTKDGRGVGAYGSRKRKNYIEEVKEPKTTMKLHSYNHVDKILEFIHGSNNLSANKNICKHFLNIKYNKKMDELTKKVIDHNRIETTLETTANTISNQGVKCFTSS